MSHSKKMQHLTIFLLKNTVKKFEDAVKASAVGSPKPLSGFPFSGILYLPTPPENQPAWLPFVQSGFPGEAVADNRMASALVMVKSGSRIFAVTFGHARHFLKPDSYEMDFGLRVVVNRVNQDNIRGISLRQLKETSVKRQEEAAKGTSLRTFGVDIQQDLLRGVTGTPDDPKFASRVSGADSLAIDVAMDFGDLGGKCRELLTAYNGNDYANRGFDWIDNLKVVRSPGVIEKLDKQLVAALKAKDNGIQMICPDGIDRTAICGFLYLGEDVDADKHTELEMPEWLGAIGGELPKMSVEGLRERRIVAFDENGAKLAEIPDRDCFVYETVLKNVKYVLSNGEWFEVAVSFDDKINKYLKTISNSPVVLPEFNEIWDEDQYVAEAAKNAEFMSMHKHTLTIEGNAIEPCDLLHSSGALVHIKLWKNASTFGRLLVQGAISAEALLQYSALRDYISSSASNRLAGIKKLYPTDGFVTSKLDVVLALVRESSKPLPFFSRLNLMREGQRIERLGYRVNYHRIKVK